MIIEIRKAGFVNKGAELMLRAIMERVQAAYPEALLTMAPTHSGSSMPFRKVVDHGFYPKASLYRYGFQLGDLAGLAPRKLREMYGVVLDRDVDVVIDAAGFSYSDQWGDRSARELAHSAARWRKQGTKVILMPQAFGPYTGKRIRKAIRRAVDNIDLVMPREQTSYDYLTDVTGERGNIRQYPDFTNLVNGVVPEYFDRNQHGVCLVPNYRMVDKTDGSRSSAYLPFMVRCAQQLKDKGAKPFILVHEGANDRWLADQISEGAGGLPVLVEDDPLKIKGILGASFATIGSRFHGLVSALSQGVPSIATGWSHKYQELFRDYGFPDGVVSVDDANHELAEKIDRLVDERSNRELSESLKVESARLKSRSEEMWGEVFSVIDRIR
ncbi:MULTISPECIES: polysaccharide pyruvyl transferase family protein [unclassified Thioalkalivibrio]|uniref:polysaccharide pyruvyl transferase family protein n=1 Tax=unclassified Thioalkalivibrio TaxID=2621013 RepID=UPI00037F3810|nr:MULTISPECIES: polysaccharide pyruvyl transferase family protein [unclassified Thioalkalivibrio]